MADLYKNKYRIASHRKPNWDYSADGLYFLTICTQNRECNLGEIVNANGQICLELSDFGKIVEQEWFKSFEIRQELFLHKFIIMPNHMHAIVEIDNQNFGGLDGDESNDDESNGDGTKPVGGFSAPDMGFSAPDMGFSAPVEAHGRAPLPPREPKPHESEPREPHDSEPKPKPKSISESGINPQRSIHSIDHQLLSIKRNPPIRLPKSISSFIGGFKSAVNTKIDDYIDEHRLEIPKYNRNNHFFQPNYHDHIIRNHWEYNNISNYISNNPMNWNKDKFNGKL